MKWRMVQRDGVGEGENIYKVINIYNVFVCKNIYVFSLPLFILALFLASRGGWKLPVAIVECMVRNSTIGGQSSLAYYRGEKFVTYVWEESVPTIGGKSSLPLYGEKEYYRGKKFVNHFK